MSSQPNKNIKEAEAAANISAMIVEPPVDVNAVTKAIDNDEYDGINAAILPIGKFRLPIKKSSLPHVQTGTTAEKASATTKIEFQGSI